MSRDWMYLRLLPNGGFNPHFLAGLDEFLRFASSQPQLMDGEKIKCPCVKCKNIYFRSTDVVQLHLAKKGFTRGYEIWRFHGENEIPSYAQETRVDVDVEPEEEYGTYHAMVHDLGGPSFNNPDTEEDPNATAKLLYELLDAADQELYPGCKNHTQLSFVARLMTLKARSGMPQKYFNELCVLLNEAFPDHHKVPMNYYSTQKLLRAMGLPVEKIDSCRNHCMIYWEGDSHLVNCKFCNESRYKDRSRGRKQVSFKKMYYFPLTPRLQRLYASKATAGDMIWHSTSADDGVMRHPADSPAWKHFNVTYPGFAAEPRNIRLGLSTDGFQPYGQSGQQYSSWPVILTPYNLPPWLCMKEQHMFLTVLVPGPRNPKDKIDVYLQPLISELNQLWTVGAHTYDVSRRQNFQMHAALMWTISDFPAYSMLSGWSTAGRLACPRCMEQTEAFSLTHSRKQSWFDTHRKFLPYDHQFRRNRRAFRKNKIVADDPPERRSGEEILYQIEDLGLVKVTEDYDDNNKRILRQVTTGWRKKSIFWDLPYWSSLLIRHNLDVMHIEKNVFDNIFNTVMNVQGKTKDTAKSREELNLYCHRPQLMRDQYTNKYPKACYTLDKKERKVLCEWVKTLKFPDGYVSNMGRCVDMSKLKMFGMKSHDCHVFMQRILPVAFRELLPQAVWKSITELCLFFRDLTSRNIKSDDMETLNNNIPLILCKLERIFPPSFFDSMEHLPIHLADEARDGGPVQYRWMYPFERYLRKLKNNVKNKSSVEGSICNAYLVEEATAFCSYYFEDHVSTKHREVPRNYVGGCSTSGVEDQSDLPSVFKLAGTGFGKTTKRSLDPREYRAAHLYVLHNCVEIDPYIKEYESHLRHSNPWITDMDIDKKMSTEFPEWFCSYVQNCVTDPVMWDIARGPSPMITSYHGYLVNGYKFHTISHGTHKATMSSGVCIKAGNYGDSSQTDFYGQLVEVCELTYPGLHNKKVVLFKCDWFDTSPAGTRVDTQFNLVSVNHTRRLRKYEPFVLAIQATQVYYCSYPSMNQQCREWWEACSIKARATIDESRADVSTLESPFQEDDDAHVVTTVDVDDITSVARDGEHVEIEDDDDHVDSDNVLETEEEDDEDDEYQEDEASDDEEEDEDEEDDYEDEDEEDENDNDEEDSP